MDQKQIRWDKITQGIVASTALIYDGESLLVIIRRHQIV